MQITEIPNTPWRDALMPASFRGVQFHVEAGSREGGRRIVLHEFPKRDLPYAEDMGSKAIEFSVRGYCIAYPHDTDRPLYQRDYRVPRNQLIVELEREGDGVLQLPLLPPMNVVVQRYRLTEEQKAGGFCVFDMSFVEFGRQRKPIPATREEVTAASKKVVNRTVAVMNDKGKTTGVTLTE